ncbi:hypothetical protein POM88_053936 [Heracleum sosnowskyi]|uniref:Uncharacterized protein n=1 Tax=Heracleum sosnowskyi TaxID=360622 RepID=A0AAD8LWS8_9APIA|nr:hypothetical protein POM88_053936 [Heracleum sosnowskyi]
MSEDAVDAGGDSATSSDRVKLRHKMSEDAVDAGGDSATSSDSKCETLATLGKQYVSAIELIVKIRWEDDTSKAVEEKDRLCSQAGVFITERSWSNVATMLLKEVNQIYSQASKEDIVSMFTAIFSLINETNSIVDQLNLVNLIATDLVEQTHKPAMQMQLLSDLFHSLDNDEAQFLVCSKVLYLAKSGEVNSNHIKVFRKIDSITENCVTDFADKRQVLLSISNVLKENARGNFSLAMGSHKFLIKYLATFNNKDENLAGAKRESARAIIEVFRLPNLFLCPWYDYPAVTQLEGDPYYEVVHQLLKVFVSQGLDAYLEFYNENTKVLEDHGLETLVHKECLEKMRLLSLRDLCDNFVNRRYKDVSYSLIEDTLQIKEDEVLTWVKMAKHAGLLRCSISRKYKFITPSWCSDRPSDLSKWPLIRLKGIDWIEKYPELGKEVTHQKNRACYAHGCAKGVGLLYRKEHGSLEEWIPARQEIIDRVCKAFPKAGNKNDVRDDDLTKTIPISYTHCLELIIKHGVGFEKDYPYVVNRNLNKSFPPGKEEYPRIFIKGYEWLGSVYDGVGDKSMLNIFKGGHKCILIANITITSTFLDLKTEFYDHTIVDLRSKDTGAGMRIVVDPLIEKQRLREGMMSDEIFSEDLVHTVVIVAFDVTLRRVKILNSWGSEWGVDGKAWVNINQLYDITRVYSSSLVTECPKPKDRSSTLNYNLRSMDTRKKATSSCKVGMLGASEEIFTAQSCQATAGNGGRRMQFAREPEEFVAITGC